MSKLKYLTTNFLILLFITSVLITSCSTQTIGDSDAVASEDSNTISIFFAGSFHTGAPCQKYDGSGCDLYSTTYNFETNEIVSAERLTTNQNTAEEFPAVDPNNQFVLYQIKNVDGTPDIGYIILKTKEEGVLIENAKAPYISSDGTLFAYALDEAKDQSYIYLMDISFSNGEIVLSNERRITDTGNSKEPIIFPGNLYLAYYESSSEVQSGQTLIYNLETTEVFEFSYAGDGCSHGSVNYDASAYFCGTTGRYFEDNSWSELTTFIENPGDPNFFGEECEQITIGHSEYCGDNEHYLTTVSCKQGEDILYANLAIVNGEGEIKSLFHNQVVDYFGIEFASSRTGVCSEVEK
tara:strand:- start:11 stop:1066 length:1056 start_codon:yes stop_codon:yes gene_type:complete